MSNVGSRASGTVSTVEGVGQHDKLRQSSSLLIPLHSMSSNVKFFSRFSGSILALKSPTMTLKKVWSSL